ncbi:hypothetical protein Sjap_017356 [Stephania japonica]|uniref:Uncharacterized protein n=1 Tax=Stephania japonica TaxID=461633 RepID=A0AAP0I604_9MAGN
MRSLIFDLHYATMQYPILIVEFDVLKIKVCRYSDIHIEKAYMDHAYGEAPSSADLVSSQI